MFEGLSNFRDIGGGAMRQGLFFRSGDLSRLTENDLAILREQHKIGLICDLRTPIERRKRPSRLPSNSGIEVAHTPLHGDEMIQGTGRKMLRFLFRQSGPAEFREFLTNYYRHIAFDQPAPIREVLTLLAQQPNRPALIHCRAGRDRTGLIAALLQLLAGVPYGRVRADYLQTNANFAAEREALIARARLVTLFQVSRERLHLILTAQSHSLDEVHHRILCEHGSVETYLRQACRIEADTLRILQQALRNP